MQEKTQFRHELKYMINYADREILKAKISNFMSLDENAGNGSYKIRSVYFDDYWSTAYVDKTMGIQHRKKYRIRFYDDSDKVIKLECKIKNVNYINKKSSSLSREETEMLMDNQNDFLLKRGDDLCNEFYYQCVSRVLRPKCIVDYEREPYVFEPGDVRITFDHDVRSTVLFKDVFNSELPSIYVLEPGKLILEVKFTSFLPQIIKEMLPIPSGDFQAFSKFTYCYERAASFNPLLKKNI